MIELTLVDALRYKVGNYDKHFLYLIREDETVFYVGRALDPLDRLQQHLYGGRSGTIDRLGTFTRYHVQLADAWRFQMLTLEDCMPLIQHDLLTPEEWQKAIVQDTIIEKTLRDKAITCAEHALIAYHRPCLNVANNPQPSLLPEKYRPEDENKHGDKLAALLGIK